MSDILVIGPGRLGLIVARAWQQQNGSSTISLKFRSDNEERSSALTAEGFKVLSDQTDSQDLKVDRIVFCAPPTGNPNYASDVENGFKNLKEGGLFVFTSAGSVYAENSGGTVDENSELARSERSGKLIDAEKIVLEKGGCVIRLGGLYSEEAGVQNYYARGGQFNALPHGLINLIHYQDAGAAVLTCLGKQDKVSGSVLLVADGCPVSRLDILNAVRSSSKAKDMPEVTFTGGEGVDGKRYDVSKIKSLGWSPTFPSLHQFMSKL